MNENNIPANQADQNPAVVAQSWKALLGGVAASLLWGSIAAIVVVLALSKSGVLLKIQPELQGLKLATVDIAKVLQEAQSRALINPADQGSVGAALESAAQTAEALEPILKYMASDLHPGYVLVQPQALSTQGEIPDFTDELRQLIKQQQKYDATNPRNFKP